MRLIRFVGAAVVSATAMLASALADPAQDRITAQAAANLDKGRNVLAEDRTDHTNAVRLQTLDRALYFLRRSRSLAVAGRSGRLDDVRTDASRSLVRALDDEAEIYYRRKSLSLADKRVDEALGIQRDDPRARNLAAMIAAAKSTDVYDGNVGAVAVDRIRARRIAAGIPLRDRGIGNRR
jgi:hypothetical protein